MNNKSLKKFNFLNKKLQKNEQPKFFPILFCFKTLKTKESFQHCKNEFDYLPENEMKVEDK